MTRSSSAVGSAFWSSHGLSVVLCEPQIPGNTGSVIRLTANAGASLHLIGPLGFQMDSAALRRAGLDYASLAHVALWDSLDHFWSGRAGQASGELVAPYRASRGVPDAVNAAEDVPVLSRSSDAPSGRLLATTAQADVDIWDFDFASGDVLMFGREADGLPSGVLTDARIDQQLAIPMAPGNRSLNLANAVGVVLYEALRQCHRRIPPR
ncbi:MAG: tRNA (cytidine(34)-2'-O)-methyltransferase [Acidimicrobiia bacterium]|nr:tRNA (cytidine(34)-2'-O)-methyltransferase [Acidimicrobiia bacterium]